MSLEPEAVHLGNWREAPYNRWAFSHVRELIPTANIAADRRPGEPLPRTKADLTQERFRLRDGGTISLAEFLDATFTDGFMVLKRGSVVAEWWRNEEVGRKPHIVFSVSKSITAMFAGILASEGALDPEAPVVRYVPEVSGSAYGDATVRHLLDMTVSLDFVESYLDPNGAFAVYREATGWNPARPRLANYLHGFLATLGKAAGEHGERYTYLSPNSDMLGWVIERATGARFADLLSDRIWKPMGAGFDAYITLDPRGASRTAGGICVMLEDLARFGEMIRNDGAVGGRQIIPRTWIEDIRNNGDPSLWRAADVIGFLPDGRYRSKWYVKGGGSEVMMAIGIHGQWLYIDHRAETVIAKQSSQPLPLDYPLDFMHLDVFDAIACKP